MNNKCVIFGASGAIGSSTARRLKNKGWDLHLVGRDTRKTQTIASELDASYTIGDVLDEKLFAKVANEAGDSVAGMVYAVGTLNLKSLSRLTGDDFIRDFKVNALGAALAVQTLLPALKTFPGTSSVVLFSSVAAKQGFTFHASMGMAKGAINGLTLSLAAELAPAVRINAIAPSLTETPLAENLTSNQKMAEAISKLHALGRLGQPEDMAALCEFLISKDADWITGQVFGVDGGRSTVRNKS